MSNKNQNTKEMKKENVSTEENTNAMDSSAPELEEMAKDESTEQVATESQDETARLTAEIEELKIIIEKQNKDYLLLMADFDNYRKRTLREKADLLKSGGEECLKNILPIIDDFERGLSVIAESSDIEAVKEGMNLIYNKFISYLEKNGVKAIPTENENFDTELHEAITMFPAPTPEMKGKIVDCIQKGYKLNDKVIRFSKVVVGE